MYELAHLGIAVNDSETSARFYQRVLGGSIIERQNNNVLKIVYLKFGDFTLELLEYLNTSPLRRETGIYDHLAFKVNDIQSVISRLKEQGIEFESQVPRLAINGNKIIFFKGPDGERIELIQS